MHRNGRIALALDQGYGSRQPLGTATNNPQIDRGTFSKTCHKPPCTTGESSTEAKAQPKFYDIIRLFPTVAVLGWKTGKDFKRFWGEGKACVAKEKNSVKATIGVNVDNKCTRIYEPQNFLRGTTVRNQQVSLARHRVMQSRRLCVLMKLLKAA